jgi:chloramphenicol 3-O phosphotransferase
MAWPSIVVLNGTSSAGKSSVARALQGVADADRVPLLWAALDHLFAMVPAAWGGGRGGPPSAAGFRYDTEPGDGDGGDGPVSTTIRYGEAGERTLRGFHRAVAALAAEAAPVVVDTIVLDAAEAEDWRRALAGHDVLVVGLTAPLDVLEERERRRGQPAGLARGHRGAVDLWRADLVLDSSAATPVELARTIVARTD